MDDEDDRLLALADYGLSAEIGLPSLDPIVEIAAHMFDMPMAAVNMIGSDHVFLVSKIGFGHDVDYGRDVSFCAHTITQDEVLVVEDTLLDVRFHDNPAVAAGAVRFYAGVPLRAPSGHALGALCILDGKPRANFTADDRRRLQDLAKMATDKLELRRLESASHKKPSHFEASAATSPNAVICTDREARITAWNNAAAEMFGYSEAEIEGKPLDLLVVPADRARIHAAIDHALGGGMTINAASEMMALRSGGESFPVEFNWSRWFEEDQMHFGAIIRDMTAQRREHDALYHLANFDSLTGLPNRNLLQQRTREALEAGADVALIVVDIDGFKDVNDTLGHAAGDAVLQTVTKRLLAVAPPGGVVARIGGDEFVLMLSDGNDPLRLSAIAREIITTIAEPIVTDGHEVRIAGSCGLAVAPDHGESVDELLSSADLALFQAKSGGRGRSFLFIPALRAEAVARRMYEAELYRAVERDEFILFYQPQVRLRDGLLTGAEALIRWRHPVRGLLAPSAFLPALENGALAARVGNWVIRTACAQAARWRRIHPGFRMSVNLFGAQFRTDSLVQVVQSALADNDLPPEALELEITENIILDQQDLVLQQLHALRDLGVALSFDDFGTGFASLNLLKTYPVTLIKIDKSFTQTVQSSPQDRAIVLSILDLAHKLGLGVVAEGIENRQDCEFLREHGCEKGQGYYFGKPYPADVFTEQFWPEQIPQRRR